ncbi:MAG: response regulator [Leptospiraceae bacterium]|nr:response regulator [Leptospiraceae bacterium]
MTRSALALSLGAALAQCGPSVIKLQAHKGQLSADPIEASTDQIYKLGGQWSFYPHQFIKVGQPQSLEPHSFVYTNAPSSWNAILPAKGHEQPGFGYGSYEITSRLTAGQRYGIMCGEMGIAARLYVNAELIAESGIPAATGAAEQAATEVLSGSFVASEGLTSILLHISNHGYRKGGFWNACYLGHTSSVERYYRLERYRDLFLSGAFLVTAFFHLILFLVVRRNPVLSLFALLCVLITVRLLVTNQRVLVELWPGLQFAAYLRLEIGSWLLAMPVGLHFVHRLFPLDVPIWIHRSAWLFAALLALGLAGSTLTISRLVPWSQAGLLSPAVFSAVFLIKAAIQRRPGALLFVSAALVFLAAVVNDILRTNDLIQTSQIAPLGLLLFIMAQAFLIARIYAQNESLKAANEKARKKELQDLVEERTTELKIANDARTNFFASISHELRTPVNAIVNISDLIAHVDGDRREFDTYVQLLRRSGTVLKDLINDIIDFSKLDSAHFELLHQPFPINTVIQETVEMMSGMAQSKELDLQLESESAPQDELLVLGDRMRFIQVILNLISNAIKYTEQGSVTIRQRYSQTTAGAIELYFEVQDTGPGIPAENLRTLFRPFQANRQQLNRTESGGLGLSIVDMLLKKMDSQIQLKSTVGGGSRFYFTLHLPLATDPDDAKLAASPLHPETRGPALFVDDNDVNRMLGQRMLQHLDIECDVAANGPDALQATQQKSYQLIFLDIMMPDMDGLEVLRRIRSSTALGRQPILIACTATTMDESQCDYQESGFDAVLAKPYNLETMQDAIQAALAAAT